jgi:heme/copper-type cytochrome/quinol oxidase subunit 3
LLTDVLTGEPRGIVRQAGPTYMPLFVAIGIIVATLATIAKWYWVVPVAGVLSNGALVIWLWPNKKELKKMRQSTLPAETGMPIVTTGTKTLGWLGMAFLLAVLAWVFITLYYVYFYLRLYSPQWPQNELPLPSLPLAGAAFALLPVAAVFAALAWRWVRRGGRWNVRLALAASCALAAAFFVLLVIEQLGLSFAPHTNAYGSIFYVLSWTVATVVFIGFMLAAVGLIRTWHFAEEWQFYIGLNVQLAAHFWIFTAVIGSLTYAVLYLSPYLL